MVITNERLIYYSTAVLNKPSLLNTYEEYTPSVQSFGTGGILQSGTPDVISEFMRMDADAQRNALREVGWEE